MTRKAPRFRSSHAALLLLAALATACDEDDPVVEPRETRGPPKLRSVKAFEEGDVVVAPFTATVYKEGVLGPVRDGESTVTWKDLPKPSKKRLKELFALPKLTSKPNLSPGDIVLARARPHTWYGARVIDVGERNVTVFYGGREPTAVQFHEVLAVPSTLAKTIDQHLAKLKFQHEARAAGRPKRPAGYAPKAKQRVLAPRGRSYYAGRVVSVDGNRATISWEGRDDTVTVGTGQLVPEPSGKADLPELGKYLLVKPKQADQPWEPGRVTAKTADSLTVALADGTARKLSQGEFLLLENPPSN